MKIKKLIFVLVLFAFFVGGTALLTKMREQRALKGFSPFRLPPSKQDRSYNEHLLIQKKAAELSSPSICTQAKAYIYDGGDYSHTAYTEEAQNDCYYHYATEKLDIKVCDKISSTEVNKLQSDERYAACFYEIQKKLNNFSLEYCNKIRARHKGWYLDACVEEL